MGKRVPLPKRFPDAPIVLRMKMWRPKTIVEVEGPYSELHGDLMLMVSSTLKPTKKQREAMEACLDALRPK